MLPSKCYFSRINCPFFDDNICNRPHCHFKHSKKVKNNQKNSDSNKNQENDNLFIKHLVKETVKHVFNRIDIKDGNQGNPDISSVVEDVVTDIQNSANNAKFLTTLFSKSQVIPEYKPTPIEKLKINRHIPVQVAPTRPSYQLSSCRSRNAASVHTVKYIYKDCHLDEGKHNFQNYLPITSSDLTKDTSSMPEVSNISSVSPSGNMYDVTSGSDSSNKNDNPPFTDHITHSLSTDTKQIIQFGYYTTTKVSEKAPMDFFEFNDKSVASIDKNSESKEMEICNKISNEVIIPIKEQSSQKKNESELSKETVKNDEMKKGHKINYNQTCKEEENKVKSEEFNQKKKEKSLREIGTTETEDQTERLRKTRQKLNEHTHKHLENKSGYGCTKKSLKVSEELINLEDENLSYKETVSEFSEQKITIGDTPKISAKQNKNIHKIDINKVRRLSIAGGGLPCNSLFSGPFMDLLQRWRKAKEKIRKSISQDNKKIAKMHNVESIIDEKNELLLQSSTCSQQNFDNNESNEFVRPSVKRRIAHQNNLDTTMSTIIEQKLKKARRSI